MSQQPIRITTATDVLDVIPALLGFYPTESLCAIALQNAPSGGQTVAVTARADLPTSPEALTGAHTLLATFLQRYDTLVLVAYSLDLEAARTVLQHLLGPLDPDRLQTVLIAGPQGWTHLYPHQPDAVQETNPYPQQTSAAATAAAATAAAVAGLAAHGTRDDLADSIAVPDAASTAAFQEAYRAEAVPAQPTAAQVAVMAREVTEYVRAYLAQPCTTTTTTTDVAAFLAARIQHVTVRDIAWALMDRPTGRLHADLWRGVAALTPNTEVVLPVLGLLGMGGWVSGDGALANVALERAADVPGQDRYTMLRLLAEVIERAVPPTAWDDMVTDLRRIL